MRQVSTSIANQSQALPELPRLTSFSNFLSRVSLSLHRGGSDASVEHYKWPCSDSIPESFFSCPGVAGYKVRGQNYLKDKKKVASHLPCACPWSRQIDASRDVSALLLVSF